MTLGWSVHKSLLCRVQAWPEPLLGGSNLISWVRAGSRMLAHARECDNRARKFSQCSLPKQDTAVLWSRDIRPVYGSSRTFPAIPNCTLVLKRTTWAPRTAQAYVRRPCPGWSGWQVGQRAIVGAHIARVAELARAVMCTVVCCMCRSRLCGVSNWERREYTRRKTAIGGHTRLAQGG